MSTWGRRVRLKGGHLAHWAGADQRGATLLAHGDYAWTDTLRPVADGAPDCGRCARRLPRLERMVQRAAEEDLAPPSLGRCVHSDVSFGKTWELAGLSAAA